MNTVVMIKSQAETVPSEGECQNCKIQETLDTILAELRVMRREKLPATSEKIETLLQALYIIFADAPFTAAWALEESIGKDGDSKKLLQAIKNVLPQPTVKRLSTFLQRSSGTFNNYKLQIVDPHSRAGAMFRVIK